MVARIISGVLGLLSLGCAVTTTVLQKWYEVTLDGTTTEYGLFKTCTDGTCVGIDWGDLCDSTASEAERRWVAIRIMAIVGMAMSLVGFFSGFTDAKRFTILRVVVFTLGSIGNGFAGGFALYFFQYWYFCETTPCKYYATLTDATCDDGMMYGMYLQLGATILNVLALVLAAVAMVQLPASKDGVLDEEEGNNNEPTAITTGDEGNNNDTKNAEEGNEAGNEEGVAADDTTDPYGETPAGEGEEEAAEGYEEEGNEAAAEPELPEGDWVYDEESEMYWSEESYLFLHLESGMFFDPNSGMWYNSETDEWFLPEEE